MFLPIQTIYRGKTNRCDPNFPEEFNITHGVNHWSNKEKAIELIEEVLLPYVKKKKEELGLHSTKE